MSNSYLAKLKQWAKALKRNLYVLYLACRDPRVPWYGKLAAVCVAAYAFSPIDLIPDFIPVLGYVDDLILVPLGVALALRLIPRPIIEEYRRVAEERSQQRKPVNWFTGALFILLWIALGIWLIRVFFGLFA
ncbi:YkvA family protein [Paenibacillus aurantius]|uniref:YkvA family protein n=1 Tax=Paenibacillus aurantius TaxID=2918900 RepID=A0AA96LBW9_9BACL|nr:YkvA family protein [Paenibacillus aurantius]WNQ09017.1 YkvA family protein [Paenibacillus aurantius]